MTTEKEIKRIIGSGLQMVNFCSEAEERFGGIEEMDLEDVVNLAIDLKMVKFNDDIPLWGSGPEMILIENFPTLDGRSFSGRNTPTARPARRKDAATPVSKS